MTTPNRVTCPVDDAELLAYRDGELAASRTSALRAHVAACPSCQSRLAEAELVTRTLTLGSPLRDQPAARAALHDRIATDRGVWWQRRTLLVAVLPVAVLLLVVIGFNRWLRDDDCASCPPPPPPMQVTAFRGIPAGWSALLPCPSEPAANRLPVPSSQPGAAIRPPLVAAPSGQTRQTARASLGRHPSQRGPLPQTSQQAAASNTACGPPNVARQSRPGHRPEIGVIWSPVRPGS